jgi:hypothetical protein
MRTPVLLALAASLSLAACSGGSGSSTPPMSGSGTGSGSGSNTSSSQRLSENAIDSTNSIGDPVKNLTDYNQSVSGSALVYRTDAVARATTPNGACNNGVEFYAPDKAGTANSTEQQYFYDTACTQLARDTVRLYSISGTSETVNATETEYAINNSTAIATRDSAENFINGTYGTNGFPNVADGFARSETDTLDISGSRTIDSDDELVVSAGSGGSNGYCGDSAGFNATGIASLNETFGWQGMNNGGTRTVNSNGSVTWSTTRAGSTSKGSIGSLSVAFASANTSCPIVTPEYTLTGGTTQGSYSIPITATYTQGELTNLSISGASLANGDTLNVTTNTSLTPTNSLFITGIVTNGGTQIATFAVNTFGSGTLTMTSGGAQYVMDDWHVIR